MVKTRILSSIDPRGRGMIVNILIVLRAKSIFIREFSGQVTVPLYAQFQLRGKTEARVNARGRHTEVEIPKDYVDRR